MTEAMQLDFLPQAIPIGPPHWAGYWCCPRCWSSQIRELRILPSLMFGPELEYRIGRCGDCGYWCRFAHAFGSKDGHLHRKGAVVSYGVDPAQAKEIDEQ